MKTFTAFEYLLIDACNQWGGDKLLFEERIQWVYDNFTELESKADQADKKPLYMKAVQAIRKAQRGEATGHLVGFDAVCSGVQIMSTLTGCIAGATATGLVKPNVRADAYSSLTVAMNRILGNTVNIPRSDAKDAMMTSFYGSKAKPKQIFGEDTPELDAFYAACYEVAPGAYEMLQALLGSWQPMALSHEWKLPDGFDAKVRVSVQKEKRIEIDELDGASFTYIYHDYEGTKKGLSNAANVTHSVDAYVLRSIHRRCNYDKDMLLEARSVLKCYVGEPYVLGCPKVAYYKEQYKRSTVADIVILPYLTYETVSQLTEKHVAKLLSIVEDMLEYEPFEVVTIHDEFKCHPNNMNHLRQQYINILCDLADSSLLQDLLSQLHGKKVKYQKLSNNLSRYIANSNYALG